MSIINVVVDLSHHNDPVDFVRAKAAGIVGVIHKATQGLIKRILSIAMQHWMQACYGEPIILLQEVMV